MEVVIYADVVFFINLIMDLLIFWMVSKLLKRKTNIFRLLLGAFSASILYCALIFYFNKYYNIFSSFIILMLSLIISFGVRTFKDFIKSLFYAHISAFAVGGFGIALFYFTNIGDLLGNALGFTIEYFSFKILIITISITYIAVKLASIFISKVFMKKHALYLTTITLGDKKVSINTLVDTGNSLYDPITKNPVIIAEFNSIKLFLPEGLRLMFYENKEDDFQRLVESMEEAGTPMIRMIPFKSIGKSSGMLLGFKPDKVEILKDDESIIVSDVLIGIYNLSLSPKGEYQGLLNPEIIK